MTDYIREIRTPEIMPDDQIRQSIWGQLQKMETPIESMVLTWNKTKAEYVLEIVFAGEMRDTPDHHATDEKTQYHLQIGRANAYEYDALNRLVMAGRRLYFRLREDFPMLQRDLSKYKYFACK